VKILEESKQQDFNINIHIANLFFFITFLLRLISTSVYMYRGADKSLARPTSRCILFDGENISFDATLVIYIKSTIISPIMIITRIYETQNLLSL